MLHTNELKQFSKATASLYESGLTVDTYVARSLFFISQLLPTDLIGYGAIPAQAKQLSASFDRHPPGLGQSLEAFGRLMHKYEPFRFDPAVNGGKPYSARDFFSKLQFQDLDIYQEVHAPLGFSDHCMVNVAAEGQTIFYGLFRGGSAFCANEKSLLELAQPHLANARQLALAHAAAQEVLLSPGTFAQAGFTPRESETIFWLTQGKSNREIAQLLHVRPDTVSDYLRVIFEKMGVENRVAATVHAFGLAKKLHMRALQIQLGPYLFDLKTQAV